MTYFPAGELLGERDQGAIGYDRIDDSVLRNHPRVRRVLTTLIRPDPRFFQALHWSSNRDLELLDASVKSGEFGEDFFVDALLVEARTVICRVCAAEVRVLAVDAGNVLFHRTLAERLRNHVLVTSCPRCSEPWTLQIVEVIG